MIFGSFGLLLVALALLIAAVVKSSVAIGVGSLVCTGLAVAFLVAANAYYRKTTGSGTSAERDALRTEVYAPAPAMAVFPQMAMANGGYGFSNGHGEAPPAGNSTRLPVEQYDQLSVPQAVASVDMLNLDQLHDLRRYEVEHEARKAVLAAIDTRIAGIVKLRRTLEA